MSDGPTRTCALCDNEAVFPYHEKGKVLCEHHKTEFFSAPEHKVYIYCQASEIPVFVRRRRFETCLYPGDNLTKDGSHYCDRATHDCYGCTAYAAKESRYDKCDNCIHHDSVDSSIHKECYRRTDGSLSNFVQRMCSNCLNFCRVYWFGIDGYCKWFNESHGNNCKHWQPRGPPANGDKILCYECGNYDRKTNGEQHCSKNHPHVTNKCHDYTVEPPQYVCGQCGMWQKYPKLEQTGECLKMHSPTHIKETIYITDNKCFVEKSCSGCGHFHAVNTQEVSYRGFCDAMEDKTQTGPADGHYTMTRKDSEECMCVKHNHGDKFTPWAAPVIGIAYVVRKINCKWWDMKADECGDSSRETCEDCPTYECIPVQCQKCTESADTKMRCGYHYEGCSKVVPHINKCQNCEFLRKRDCGGGCAIDNCSLKNIDVQLHTIDCTCGGCNCELFKAKTAPACVRCNKLPTIRKINIGNTEKERLVPICKQCETELSSSHKGTELWRVLYDKETAAGRPWHIDQSSKFQCQYCGENIFINVPHSCKYLNAPAAAPVKVKLCAFGKEWTADCYHKPCLSCKKTGIKTESDAKMAFKCQSCGYEDETRKKVVYCPRCGAAVEQKEKSQFWNEGIEHQTDIKNLKIDLDVITTDRNYWSRTAAQYKEENAALAQQNKEILVDRENYFVKAWKEAHDKLQEKLRQKGIPRRCKRCMDNSGFETDTGHTVGKIEWPCQFFDKDGQHRFLPFYTDCTRPKPAKPAPLWLAQLEYRFACRKHTMAVEKQNGIRKRDEYLRMTKIMKENTQEINKKLAGAA